MRRILELIREVRIRYPEDEFFSNFEQTCQENRLKREFYMAYEGVFAELDDIAWVALKEKSTRHFRDHREGQLKTGFFAQLNEAFAYRYLVSSGYKDVVFLPEGRTKQPDLRFQIQAEIGFCEVKTMGISDDEINRRTSSECFDGSNYMRLGHGFLRKLEDKINTARDQLGAVSQTNIVYVLVEFDDFTHDHLAEYRQQLQAFVAGYPSKSVIIQIGLFGEAINN